MTDIDPGDDSPALNGFRITKYDPARRTPDGRYPIDEWTSFSDVGRTYAGEQFTMAQYEATESAYLAAIELFARDSEVDSLQVRELEYSGDDDPPVAEGQIVDLAEAVEIARKVLREEMWCKLESDRFRVHFGYDYYLYIETTAESRDAIRQTREAGLFVEENFPSPYAASASASASDTDFDLDEEI